MPTRFYILPIESNSNARGPKYFAWKFDPDPPGIKCRWSAMDYGLMPVMLLLAHDISVENHTALAANGDVISVPENIDQSISAGAINQVKGALDTLNIPSDWVTTAYTYRQILRMVAGLFQFAQRLHGLFGERVLASGVTLESTIASLPAPVVLKLRAAAQSFGWDTSAIVGDWKLRRVLKYLADQWGEQVFYLGGYEL